MQEVLTSFNRRSAAKIVNLRLIDLQKKTSSVQLSLNLGMLTQANKNDSFELEETLSLF